MMHMTDLPLKLKVLIVTGAVTLLIVFGLLTLFVVLYCKKSGCSQEVDTSEYDDLIDSIGEPGDTDDHIHLAQSTGSAATAPTTDTAPVTVTAGGILRRGNSLVKEMIVKEVMSINALTIISNSELVYGFRVSLGDYTAVNKLIGRRFMEIDTYAEYLINGRTDSVVFGIPCKVDPLTGACTLSEASLTAVNEFRMEVIDTAPDVGDVIYSMCIGGSYSLFSEETALSRQRRSAAVVVEAPMGATDGGVQTGATGASPSTDDTSD